jgi:plasmid stability protein
MTITVAITPEVQAELARQAAAHGRAMEAYAASLLEGLSVFPPAPTG